MSQINDCHRTDGARIAEWIASVGRQPSSAVLAHFGMQPHYTTRCLRAALLDGRIVKVRCGKIFLWMLPADEATLRAEQRKSRSQSRNAYSLGLYHSRRAAGVIDSSGHLLDPEHWPVVQRSVPALGAAPIATRAPASVFHLGALAC